MSNSNPWDAEWDIDERKAAELIGTQFPALASEPVAKLGYGWDNTVFLVGNDYVFRFPRRSVAVASIEMEGKLLPELEAYVPLPYAKPIFYGIKDVEYPSPFLGYPYLRGKFAMGLTDEQRERSVDLLADFLRSLHAFPLEKAREFGVQKDHRILTDIYRRKRSMQDFHAKIEPRLSEEQNRAIRDYLDEIGKAHVEPRFAFLHGDLHFKNVLVDEASGIVSGIIDWGDMNIGHPACDLSIAYSFVPPRARSGFFARYGSVDEETKLLARLIAVYIPMLILMQAVDDNDEPAAAEAKATIMRALADE